MIKGAIPAATAPHCVSAHDDDLRKHMITVRCGGTTLEVLLTPEDAAQALRETLDRCLPAVALPPLPVPVEDIGPALTPDDEDTPPPPVKAVTPKAASKKRGRPKKVPPSTDTPPKIVDESDVLAMHVLGHTDAEIAEELDITEKNVIDIRARLNLRKKSRQGAGFDDHT